MISEVDCPGDARALDLGCGEGELLAHCATARTCRRARRGVNRRQRAEGDACSVLVYQGDPESGLDDYPDQVFDYVILSQTLQETRMTL